MGKPLFEVLQIGISKPRAALYKRINERAREQIKAGLVVETKKNYSKILKNLKIARKQHSHILKNVRMLEKNIWSLPSMTGLGYRQIGVYLRGELNLEQAIEILKRDTRRYARRQMTWFRRDKRINWLKNYKSACGIVNNFLKK